MKYIIRSKAKRDHKIAVVSPPLDLDAAVVYIATKLKEGKIITDVYGKEFTS